MLNNIFIKLEEFIPVKHRWILGHEGFRRYFANTGWLFLGQIIFLGLSFFIGAWLARYLGPEKYGAVSYVVAFVGLFTFLSTLGVGGVLNRELVKQPEKKNELLGTGLRLHLWGGLVAFLVSTIIALLIGSSFLTKLLIIMYSLHFLLQAPFVVSTYFYSQVQAKQAIKAQLIAALISSILKIIFIILNGDIIWLVAIYTLDTLWQSLFLVYFYKRQGFKIKAWRFQASLARSLWRDSWPLMLSSAAAFIYLRIDQVMVGRIMNEAAVGIYAAGVKLTEVFYFIPGVICGSLFPAIVNARKTNQAIYHSRLKKLYILLGVLGLLIATSVALLSGPIINFVFGADYLPAIPVLQIYIWSSVGLFLGSVVGSQLMAENRTKEIFFINFVAMILNVALNLWLIQKIGLIGAALATLVAYSVGPLWMLLRGRRGKGEANGGREEISDSEISAPIASLEKV